MHAAASTRLEYPFAAVAGMDQARLALLLLAVDAGLKGVLIASPRGTGKSLLARSFRSLLPGQEQFVEVPLGVTASRLLGGLDLERTLSTGKRHAEDGLLARAHNGFVLVDDIHLLEAGLTQHVATALETGVVRLERDGLSKVYPSRFALIGAYNPAEGDLPGSLRDSVGVHIREDCVLSQQDRVEVLSRTAAFRRGSEAFFEEYELQMARLRAQIAAAKRLLPRVKMERAHYQCLSLAALRLGVEGHRGDGFAVRLARAHAALMGRNSVAEPDLKPAIEMVLMPRARQLPPIPAPGETTLEDLGPESGSIPPEESAAKQLIEASNTPLPDDLLDLPNSDATNGGARRSGPRREAAAGTGWLRGRYVRAVARHSKSGKIAIGATLRAAAPHQLQRSPGPPVQVTPDDLRFKEFKRKAGVLIIFAVDASGSMALNRMHQAKGALLRLLQQAYVHRDQVALISFHDGRAELLLPPSGSVELAKRALDTLAVGGGTPLAAGLLAALELVRRNAGGGFRRKLLVLFTDGRANVANDLRAARGGGEAIWAELKRLGAALRNEPISSVVIDTRHRLLAGREARDLAGLLGARYVCLPHPNDEAAQRVVAEETEKIRK